LMQDALKTEDNIAFNEEAAGPSLEGCQLVILLLVSWWPFLECLYDFVMILCDMLFGMI
jgi:hypothetical protein